MKRVNVNIDDVVEQYFKEKKKRTGIPVTALMNLALLQYVQQDTMLQNLPDMLKQMEELKKLAEIQLKRPEGIGKSDTNETKELE